MLELNHKIYEIYGEENKSVEISNPKETQILINGEPNGAMLHDVFKKIDDLETNRIFGWSILEFYKVEEGCLCDDKGNKITLLEGDTQIFFKRVKNPLIILNEKDVSLEYVRDVSSLLGLAIIEETITGLSDEDKQILIEERMSANQKRQNQIAKEKADAETEKKRQLEAEQKRIQQEQEEEQERLDKLEQERLDQEKKEREELEEKERIDAENLAIAEAEEEARNKSEAERQKLISDAKAEAKKEFEVEMEERRKEEEEEKRKLEAQKKEEVKKKVESAKKEEEEEEDDDSTTFDPKQFRSIRKSYANNDVNEYQTEDAKFTFFYSDDMSGDDEPMLVLKRDDGKYQELAGELTEDGEKFVEYEFAHEGKDKVVVLNKKSNSIKIEVID